jgi:hypothetical protein
MHRTCEVHHFGSNLERAVEISTQKSDGHRNMIDAWFKVSAISGKWRQLSGKLDLIYGPDFPSAPSMQPPV